MIKSVVVFPTYGVIEYSEGSTEIKIRLDEAEAERFMSLAREIYAGRMERTLTEASSSLLPPPDAEFTDVTD